MVVGMLQVSLFLPENASLKGKRKVVKSLLDRLKARFNVAAAEVGDNDLWQRIVIGMVAVGNDRRFINSVLDNLLDYIEQETEAQVLDSQMEIDTVFSDQGSR